jgi:hypothetical protein
VPNHSQRERADNLDKQLQTPKMVGVAANLTRNLLHSNPGRLAHSQSVARRAELLTLAVEPQSAPLLVAAGWLRDIGYARTLHHITSR